MWMSWRRMGADIQVEGRVAVVTGAGGSTGPRPRHRPAGRRALVVAGLGGGGDTRVTGLAHIRRGYDGLESGCAPWGRRSP